MRDRVVPGEGWHAPVRQIVIFLNGAIQQANRLREPTRREPREVVAKQLDLGRRGHSECEQQQQDQAHRAFLNDLLKEMAVGIYSQSVKGSKTLAQCQPLTLCFFAPWCGTAC